MATRFISLDVLGDKELDRNLREVGSVVVQRRVVQTSLRKAMKDIVEPQAKANAPVLSGRTKAKIVTRVMKVVRRSGLFGMRVMTGRRQQMGIPPNAKYYYPAAKELGTKTIKAEPFMRPALYNNSAAIFRSLRTNIWRLLKGEAIRLGRRQVRLNRDTGKIGTVR